MKKQSLTAMMVLFISAVTFAKNVKPINTDFSGSWKLNVEKSDIGNFPQLKSGGSVKITQLADMMIMLKSIKDSTGKEFSGTDTVTFDGKSKQLADPSGKILHKSVTRTWSADGKIMNIISKFTMDTEEEPVEFEGTETWSLDESGKVLTIANETVIGERVQKMKLVYTKQ